jgi:hypothetical protein
VFGERHRYVADLQLFEPLDSDSRSMRGGREHHMCRRSGTADSP